MSKKGGKSACHYRKWVLYEPPENDLFLSLQQNGLILFLDEHVLTFKSFSRHIFDTQKKQNYFQNKAYTHLRKSHFNGSNKGHVQL